jgi:2-keto-4-pentenoate hydratase/2-oxohepta-3-ene-1,7-dioic acid hydratase in catechol pathway
MKLYSWEAEGRRFLGVRWGQQLIDLPVAYGAMLSVRPLSPGAPGRLPNDMLSLLRMGEIGLTTARATLHFIAGRPATPVAQKVTYSFAEVKILAPIPRPGKILCSGINYRGHLEENLGAKIMTLEPGDVVTTGTPAGVGVFRKPPVFLKPGDVVRLEIEGIGVIENPVIASEL